jgi:alpha-L-rhamnosidase
VHIDDLRTEMRTNPLGFDQAVPRFSWILVSDRRGAAQTAYQIRVAGDADALERDDAVLFDSGKCVSDQSHLVPYGGPPLSSRQRCYWQVRVWDELGEATAWSAPAFWEMALLSSTDWQANWISPPGQEPAQDATPPAIFRKAFALRTAIKRARIYVTARGVYDLVLNGERVGEDFLAPGWTSYRSRIHYQIYDVTNQLCVGDNVIGATLADGWFRGPIFDQNQRNQFGTRTSLLMQIEIEYIDGTIDRVLSDGSWCCSTGAILASEMHHGDMQDRRLEPAGWSEAGFDDSGWRKVEELAPTTAELVAPSFCLMRKIGAVTPLEVVELPDGSARIDFGQNMVGWVRLIVSGEAGQTIIVRHAEILDGEGALYTQNLRSARQTCTYILAGDGEEVLEPRFSYQGFRFVTVEGWKGPLDPQAVTGIVVHSDMEPTGHFETSDPMLNQLQSNILWGQKGNFVDLPVDCPQRDERLGWTGDAQIFAPTAAFNMHLAHFFKKWLADVAAEQTPAGAIPFVVPSVFGGAGAAGWSDVATIVPWLLYTLYGDREQLARHYPMMRKWVAYMEERAGADLIWSGDFQFGDWLDFFSSSRGTRQGLTSEELIATAFYAHSTHILAKAADVLGDTGAAAFYARSFDRIRKAFQARWVSAEGVIAEDTQAAYVFALAFDLLDEELRPKAAARLAGDVAHRGHLTTGFLGTPLLLDTLTRFGYIDAAYRLLNRREYPSWLYPITMGATTIWERWDGIRPDGSVQDWRMNSFNHYAYGAVGDWMYRTIGGITAESPAYKVIRIAPVPGGGLTSAASRLRSPYGEICSAWRLDADAFILDVTIPPNTQAIIDLPYAGQVLVEEAPVTTVGGIEAVPSDGKGVSFQVQSGCYSIRVGLA